MLFPLQSRKLRAAGAHPNCMIAVTGITGKVGGEAARQLLAQNHPVRAVLRDPAKASPWSDLGCEVAVADLDDAHALAQAFTGAEAVFLMVPPRFDPQPGFPDAHETASTFATALRASKPGRVVYLSTVGAQSTRENLLTQHTIIEQALRELTIPVTFLRPGWFMDNIAWDVAPARDTGVIPSFLQPLDRAIPMVATADIGRVAAELLTEPSIGHRFVELEGPRRISPNDIAATFSRLLNKPVRMEAVSRSSWESLFTSQGMQNPTPRVQMLDGFNEGWIAFEDPAQVVKGRVNLEAAIMQLLAA
jgi:NAD(P)H dehydrogenase (quinone)